MKNYLFLLIAIILLGFNVYQLDFESFFSEDGKIALIGVLGCLIAIVLLIILISSNKINNKINNKN
jgi:FtsH-binding integral membrane protein